jgi:hypothetical protein
MSRPAIIPAIEAWRPDATVAPQMNSATITYGHVFHTCPLPRRARTTTPTAARISAATCRVSV